MTRPIISKDLPASLVVFLVALPLSLGIALASGASPTAGLIAAGVGGILVGLLGGAPLQVSGPAAGLTVIVAGLIEHYGFGVACSIGMLAGLLQIALGSVGAAQLTLIISPAVIHAMLAGIGILISLGQLHVVFGFKPGSSAIANLGALPEHFLHANMAPVIVGLFTYVVLYSWKKWLEPKVQFLPASLIAVVAGTALASILNLDVARVDLEAQSLFSFHLPSLGGYGVIELLMAALALGVVASAESLLCAIATDQLHAGPRANLNKELRAQGIGNVVSGFLGGLPITGVIVRSTANISAGGKTHWSAVLHGVWILLFASLLAGILTLIPLAVLAALLISVGVGLVKVKEMKKLTRFREHFVYAATLLGVVFINLLWGIGIGFALAIFFLLLQLSRVQISRKTEGDSEIVTISGSLSFLCVPVLTAKLAEIPGRKIVHLILEVDHIDHAAIEAIRGWQVGYERQGGKVQKPPLEILFDEKRKWIAPA